MKKLFIYVLLASFAFGQGQVLQEASVAQAAAGTAGAGYYISPRRQGGGTGSPGTVTSVSVTPTATVTGTVTNASTTPALELTAITNPSPSGSNLVSGGSVAFVSNLTLTVAAATYVIQGVQYSSPITTLTASAADPTFDRIDIVAVNSSGAAVLIEGTPAASPVAPDVDPASQLGLTFYILAAGATSIPVSVTDIYHNNAEWTMSRSGTTWTLASTNNPYTGSVCIEGTAVATGNSFTATAPSDIDLADHDNLIFYIRNKAAWPSTRQISIQWLNNSNVAKGTVVTLKNGSYGFNALTNTTAYQQIAIPLSAFGANGLAVRKLRFQLAGTGATIGAYVDDITLQGGLAPVVDTTKMQWRGPYNASNLYNINDVVISGGIQYVAIAPSVGQTPASSATFWQPSTANSGGSVTSVSVTTANGVSGSVATATTTPAITLSLGAITPTSVATTGIDSVTGANVTVATPITLTANAGTVDVTKSFSTASNNADTTLSFSGTPANSNQWFTYEVTNTDTSNHVWTIPSTFDVNAQALTTSFTVLAGGTETITTRWNGSRYLGYGIPSPAYSAEITVASATTTNIGAAASVNVAISGTTAITGFGTVAAGTYRQGRFTGILTFTHNASSLILPNAGSNITTAANDRFGAYSLGSGNWLVLWYQRADGTAVAGGGGGGSPGGSSGQVQYNNSGSFGGITATVSSVMQTNGSGVASFTPTPTTAAASGEAGFASSTSDTAAKSYLSSSNGTVFGGLATFGSAYATTQLQSKAVLYGVGSDILILPNWATNTGATNKIVMRAGGYANTDTLTINPGSPGTVQSGGAIIIGSAGANPGSIGASKGVLDVDAANNKVRWFAYGPDASTNGKFYLNSQRSDGSNSKDVLITDTSGNATFIGSVTGTSWLSTGTATASYGIFNGTNAGGSGANSTVLDNFAGAARLFAYGPDSSTNGTFTLNSQRSNGSNSTNVLTTDTSGNITVVGTLKTAAPSGGTAQPFKIGAVSTTTPTAQNRTIEIEINGTTYYLTAKTTNN